jgi:predicted nucleic acid-binding protein
MLARTADLVELAGVVPVPAHARDLAWDQVRESEHRSARVLLDTNILVRHLTGEPVEQASRATTFLAEAETLELPSLIVAELVHVLESVYEQTRPQVSALVRAVLAYPPVRAAEETVLLRDVELYETTRVPFAEAYLAATAERSDGLVASFDRIDSVTRVAP